MMTTPNAHERLLRQALDIARTRETDSYLVGGALRDALLGRVTVDWDIAVSSQARELAQELAHRAGGAFVAMDSRHDIYRVVLPGPAEPLILDISQLANGSLSEDLGRRDFTINAMAVPLGVFLDGPWRKSIVDPFDGQGDIAKRRVKLVSSMALADDPLRLLRAVRLAATLNMAIYPETWREIAWQAHLITNVSPERVRDELLKLLDAPDTTRWLMEMDALGLLTRIIPELEAARNCTQPPEGHYWDVLNHTLNAVGYADKLLYRRRLPHEVLSIVPWDDELRAYFDAPAVEGHTRKTLVKLGSLLHDIAKPPCRKVREDGRIIFYGHAEMGAQMATEILTRLRFSRRTIDTVATMVDNHLRPSQMTSQGEELPGPRAIYRFHRDLGEAALPTLYMNLADYLAARGPRLELARWQHHVTIIRTILEGRNGRPSAPNKPRLITGNDLIRELRMQPGPALGRLLNAVEEAVGAGEVTTKEEALQLASRLLASRDSNPSV